MSSRSLGPTLGCLASLVLFITSIPALAQDQPAPTPPADAAQSTDRYDSPRLKYLVRSTDQTWHDQTRNRDIPVRIYLPAAKNSNVTLPAKLPVIIFSHGLGASRTNYAYFGDYLASRGYIVIHPTHPGSDTQQLSQWVKAHGAASAANLSDDKGWLKTSINDPDNLASRPLDISFIIDQLSTNETLKDIADLSRIGVAGHSFGAYTAMAIGGMTVDLPDAKSKSFRDSRVKAVLPMSPEGPGVMGITDSSWDRFAVPILSLTGTYDYGVGERPAEWRQSAFTHIHSVDNYLFTLTGAGHMTFGTPAAGVDPAPQEDPKETPAPGDEKNFRARRLERMRNTIAARNTSQQHTALIESLSLAFFDAYLLEDAKAREWLQTYTLPKSTDYTAQFKPAATPAPAVPPSDSAPASDPRK